MREYKPRAGSVAQRALDALKAHPPGTAIRTKPLAVLAGAPLLNFALQLKLAVEAGLVLRDDRLGRKRLLWSLPQRAPIPIPAEVPITLPNWRPSRETPEWRSVQKQFAQPAPLIGTLRDLLQTGIDAPVGDPLRGLADAMDAARKVLTAKASPTARFKGAEVDRFVARELRQIADAAERAKVNLIEALEIME